MSFNITLQKNLSEAIKVHKNVTDVATVIGELRDSSTISNPNVLIEGSLSDYIDVNYFTIPSFKRSYFVTEKTSFRSGLVELTGRTDVLSSDIPTLEAQKAIIKRQTDYYNLLLNDGSIHAYQNPHIIELPFEQGFDNAQYVLIVAGVALATGIRITQQPENAAVANVGDTATFTVVAVGEGLTYQWQEKFTTIVGSPWYNIQGANQSTYSFVTTSDSQYRQYRCQITSAYGATAYTNEVEVHFS